MKFAVLGSCIGVDTVQKSNYKLIKSFVSISPLSILKSAVEGKHNYPATVFNGEPTANKLIFDLNGTVLSSIADSLSDDGDSYVLVDLSDFRLNSTTLVTESGQSVTYTTRKYSSSDVETAIEEAVKAEFNSPIKKKVVTDVRNFSDSELSEVVNEYVDLLYNTFGKDRVIIFKPKLTTNYIDGNNIYVTPNFRISGNTNLLIDKIYAALSKDITYIDAPRKIIGDAACLSPFEYHFCQPYYDYLINASKIMSNPEAYDKSGCLSTLLQKCEAGIYALYNRIFCEQVVNAIKARVPAKDVVLIARTEQFSDIYEKALHKPIYKYLKYDENTEIEDIISQISAIKEHRSDIVLAVPELISNAKTTPDYNLFRALFDIGFSLYRDFYCFVPKPILLENVTGYFEDVMGNRIMTISPLPSVRIWGMCTEIIAAGNGRHGFKAPIVMMHYARCIIDEGVKAVGKIGIRARHCSSVYIGKKSEFVNEISINTVAFSNLSIGKDCLFAENNCFHPGNGHAIFDTSRKERLPEKRDIVIGNHVWIGRNCTLLGGTHIGDGSIIGACSLVTGKVPNNCIAAGSPARVIKRNRAWSRDNFIHSIEQDEFVFDNYYKPTQDD